MCGARRGDCSAFQRKTKSQNFKFQNLKILFDPKIQCGALPFLLARYICRHVDQSCEIEKILQFFEVQFQKVRSFSRCFSFGCQMSGLSDVFYFLTSTEVQHRPKEIINNSVWQVLAHPGGCACSWWPPSYTITFIKSLL